MVLLEDFAQWHQGVPGVFGIGKNRFENNVGLFHAGWQAIYGTYSPLSFPDNHADTAISHLRMNIELRLRHGFGVLGLTDIGDGTFVPLSLSKLVKGVSHHQANITLARPIAHIDRIYRWQISIFTEDSSGTRGAPRLRSATWLRFWLVENTASRLGPAPAYMLEFKHQRIE